MISNIYCIPIFLLERTEVVEFKNQRERTYVELCCSRTNRNCGHAVFFKRNTRETNYIPYYFIELFRIFVTYGTVGLKVLS
jgi:hypothetical protein